MTSSYTPLTREQKLLAEIVVQLGNVTEAIRAAAAGEDSGTLLSQIQQLQSELSSVSQNNAALAQQLASANEQVANLQTQLANQTAGDITPDSINEVIAHLGIEVGQ